MFENAMTVTGHSWRVSSTSDLLARCMEARSERCGQRAKARRWLDRLRRRATARGSGDGSDITRASRMDMTSRLGTCSRSHVHTCRALQFVDGRHHVSRLPSSYRPSDTRWNIGTLLAGAGGHVRVHV